MIRLRNVLTVISRYNRKAGGFTLIELLVALSILAILFAIGMASYTNSQRRARDVQRKTELNHTQKALELYKHDLKGYPDSLDQLVSPFPYLKESPHDPGVIRWNWPDYSYSRNAANVMKYTLYACFENLNDDARDGDDGSVEDKCVDKGVSYTVTEP